MVDHIQVKGLFRNSTKLIACLNNVKRIIFTASCVVLMSSSATHCVGPCIFNFVSFWMKWFKNNLFEHSVFNKLLL